MQEKILMLIIREISCAEDNVNRAKRCFAGMTQEQLNEPYGGCKETRGSVLSSYQNTLAEARAMKEWFIAKTNEVNAQTILLDKADSIIAELIVLLKETLPAIDTSFRAYLRISEKSGQDPYIISMATAEALKVGQLKTKIEALAAI